MKYMKNEGLEMHTREEMLKLGWNQSGEDEKEWERYFFYWERMREMKYDFALKLFKEIAARWIEDLLSTNSWQIKSVKVLSRIYWRQKYLDGLNSYRAAIGQTETFLMDQEFVEKLLIQIPDSLMDWNNDKIFREKKFKRLNR